MAAIFITATGTDVGKTFVACALIRALRAEHRVIDAFKPVLSGYVDYEGSDAALLLDALGKSASALDHMSPLRFQAPIAPPSAARLEGQFLELDELIERCQERMDRDPHDILLIEGAGGIMSPLAEGATNLDLVAELGLPVILVAGSYLGSVSHTLTALAALEFAGVQVRGVVISQSEGDTPPILEMTRALETFAPDIPVVVAPRDPAWTAEALAAWV